MKFPRCCHLDPYRIPPGCPKESTVEHQEDGRPLEPTYFCDDHDLEHRDDGIRVYLNTTGVLVKEDLTDRVLDRLEDPKVKEGAKKWSPHLVPLEAIQGMAEAFQHGQDKGYPERSWEKSSDWRKVYYNAAIRHLTDWFHGKCVDPQSGQTALNHALASVAILKVREVMEQGTVQHRGDDLELLKRTALSRAARDPWAELTAKARGYKTTDPIVCTIPESGLIPVDPQTGILGIPVDPVVREKLGIPEPKIFPAFLPIFAKIEVQACRPVFPARGDHPPSVSLEVDCEVSQHLAEGFFEATELHSDPTSTRPVHRLHVNDEGNKWRRL